MAYPFGATPPSREECPGCFDSFNVFAMECEGEFGDHVSEVKMLADSLRGDRDAIADFVREAERGTPIAVNGVELTWNDIEQVYVALDLTRAAIESLLLVPHYAL